MFAEQGLNFSKQLQIKHLGKATFCSQPKGHPPSWMKEKLPSPRAHTEGPGGHGVPPAERLRGTACGGTRGQSPWNPWATGASLILLKTRSVCVRDGGGGAETWRGPSPRPP